MEGSDAVHRAAAPDLALRLQQSRQDARRTPYKKPRAKVIDEDQVELHDEKIVALPCQKAASGEPHLDISA